MSKQKLPESIQVTADIVQELVSQGLNQQQVALKMGITPDHLSRLKRIHVEISQAIIRGRELFIKDLPKAVQDSIIKQIQGYEYEEVETLYEVELDEDGREIEVVKARRRTKKYAKPNSSMTRFAAERILTDWEDPEEVKEEKSELQEQLVVVKRNPQLVEAIKAQIANAIKNRGK